MTSPRSITELLVDWSNGNRAALDELTPHVYRELHDLARIYLSRGRPNQTLQPTALINEVYLRLIDQSQPIQWEGRAHFFGIAAHIMRQILVEYARGRSAAKRGGSACRLTLDEAVALPQQMDVDVVQLDKALTARSLVREIS